MAEQWLIPKFTRRQVVRISLHDQRGKAKNKLARKALPYFAQTAEAMSYTLGEMSGKVVLVYKVRVDDGTVLQLTEDCLMTIKERI